MTRMEKMKRILISYAETHANEFTFKWNDDMSGFIQIYRYPNMYLQTTTYTYISRKKDQIIWIIHTKDQ